MCHPAVTIRKSALDTIGGYWDLPYGEDWDLFLRLAEVGRLANLDQHVLDYTYNDTGMNALGTEAMRANMAFAICNHRRRVRGLEELNPDTYFANVGVWERIRVRAQSRSLRAYRRSMHVETSNPAIGKLLLAEAAVLWPPFATRRVSRSLARRIPRVRPA
jgi:hypothetical protein